MIKVHIWKPVDLNVGHSSVLLGCNGEPHSSYVSWWPERGSDLLKGNSGTTNDYEGDLASEDNFPPIVWSFNGLNEVAASNWWTDFLSGSRARYRMHNTNCSWAAIKALKEAGADRYISWTDFDVKYNLPVSYILKDGAVNMVKHLRFMYEQYKKYKANIKKERDRDRAMAVASTAIVDRFSSIWSPDDVNTYCELLDQSMNKPNPSGFSGLKKRK
ncbi:MAG: hypothetical protein ABI675_20955 [Chitinophagaceae bacterium]